METIIKHDYHDFRVSINVEKGFSVPVVSMTICYMVPRKFFPGLKVKEIIHDNYHIIRNVDKYDPLEEARDIIFKWTRNQRNIQELANKLESYNK